MLTTIWFRDSSYTLALVYDYGLFFITVFTIGIVLDAIKNMIFFIISDTSRKP